MEKETRDCPLKSNTTDKALDTAKSITADKVDQILL